MCVGNKHEITEQVINSYKMGDCCTYKQIIILLLIFGYLSALMAWIFTSSSQMAIIADTIYTLCMIITTMGLIVNNYYGFIALLIAFVIDVFIAIFVIIFISISDDLSSIIGDKEIGKLSLILIFIFFAIIQTFFTGILIKIITDIKNQTSKKFIPPNRRRKYNFINDYKNKK